MSRSLIRNNLRGLVREEYLPKSYSNDGRIVYFKNVTINSKSMKRITITRGTVRRTYFVAWSKGENIRKVIESMAVKSGQIFGLSTYKV